MAEELAQLYYPDARQEIEFLTQNYGHRSKMVEMRLHGNDKLTDVLKKMLL